MSLKRGIGVAAVLTAECIAFVLGLLAVFWSLGDVLHAWWEGVLVIGLVYSAIGALPMPQLRRGVFIGIAAFLVPLFVLGWIHWRIEYFLLFEYVGAWENLPRVVLGPGNLGIAGFLSLCAIVGHHVSRQVAIRRAERLAHVPQSGVRR